MENIKEVLEKLSDNDMHVHDIEDDATLPIHTGIYDTHYIMKGDKIVHVGNLRTIESFALSLNKTTPTT
jgi:hypothetical protein